MAILSTVRSRRSQPQAAPTQQYVVFRLQAAWFILPVTSVYRVLPLPADPMPQLTFGGQPLPVLDLRPLLFPEPAGEIIPLEVGGAAVADLPALMVVSSRNHTLVALPTDSQPALLRLTPAELVPIPPTYPQQWQVDFLTRMTLPSPTRPALFEIDADRLGAIASR